MLILQTAGGGLHDTILAAVYAALATTNIPAARILKDAEGNAIDWELTDEADRQLDCRHFPVSITVQNINDYPVTDATLSEEACSSAALHVAIDEEGLVCATRLSGGSAGIDPALMEEMLLLAQRAGRTLIANLKDALSSEMALKAKTEQLVLGFLR